MRRRQILKAMQTVMGELPGQDRRCPLDAQVLEETDAGDVLRKKISYMTEPGDRVSSYLLIPAGGQASKPAVLCLHQTTRIGKAEPVGLGGQAHLHYALELARRGFVTLAPDYPRFGEYTTDPYSLGYASATMKGIWNHMRALDLLALWTGVDGERLGCMGHSLGGQNAVFLAVFDERVRAVVTSCGFTAFAKYKQGNLAGWSRTNYMPRISVDYGNDPSRMPFDFPEALAAIAPRPVWVNAPMGDVNFDVSGVRDCMEAARAVYEILAATGTVPVAEHPDCGHDFPAPTRDLAYAFLEKYLGCEERNKL